MSMMDLDFDAAWAAFADAALGGRLAPEVEALLRQSANLRQQPKQALALLEQARELAPSHPVPLIALYRFHFFGHELVRAREVGAEACKVARAVLGPRLDEQKPSLEATRFDAAVRFYLFTLKGLAYLNLRLGDYTQARSFLDELRRLDPDDRVGAAVLEQVLGRRQRQFAGEEDDAEESNTAVRGWTEVTQ